MTLHSTQYNKSNKTLKILAAGCRHEFQSQISFEII